MSTGILCALSFATASLGSATVPQFPVTTSTVVGGIPLTSESDDTAALVGVQIFIAAGLALQTKATNGAAALVAECVLRTPVTEGANQTTSLRDAVAEQGGSISYGVDDRTVHYYVEARAERVPDLLALFAAALRSPTLGGNTLAAARKALSTRVTEAEKNPLRVGVQMFKESIADDGAAYPEFGTVASLTTIGAHDLRAFYGRTYRRGAVTVSATGRVTSAVNAAIGTLAQSLPAGGAMTTPASRSLPANGKRILAQRDVGRPFVVVGFRAPAPGDSHFGAMLVLEALLSHAFERSSATTLSLGERSVGAVYLYDGAPSSLVVYVNGGTGVDPLVALREVLLVTKSLSARPLGTDALARFKEAAQGELVTTTTTLADRSYLMGVFASSRLGQHGLNGALDAIARSSAHDVQAAAKAYLQRYVVALVLPRQGQQE